MSSDSRVEEIFEEIRAGFGAGRLAQAYLLVGPVRQTALPFAERVVSLLFCQATQRPCGRCAGCRGALAHTQADVLWVEPQKKSQQILIGQVRDIQKHVYQTSFGGGWKVCVLVGVDRLGVEAANAFLKTLEEPPPRCLFLMLTESPQTILPTILSRCQRVTLAGGQTALSRELWEPVRAILAGPEFGPVTGVWRSRQLVRLLADLRKSIEREEKDAAAEGVDKETIEARVNARYKETRTGIMRAMVLWYRDLLLRACGGDPGLLHYSAPEDMALASDQAAALSSAELLNAIRNAERMQQLLDENVNEDAVFSAGLGSLTQAR